MSLTVSCSEVRKLSFSGGLGERALYLYLPPGYHDPDAARTRYPVLYLHDGQNCFETFSEDAFGETWRAEHAADEMIAAGHMRHCIIVGVSNGGEKRLEEYGPPYSRVPDAPRRRLHRTPRGRADELYREYLKIARFITTDFRVLPGRDHTATCGSSMGGLFSAYLAFEHPEFAKHHGMMSPSFWTTEHKGKLELLRRLRRKPVQDVRLWLDSGEGEGDSDDNKTVTLLAKDALLKAGYKEGGAFVYHFFPAGTHTEASWAARFPAVLSFLFPATPEDTAPQNIAPQNSISKDRMSQNKVQP